MARTSLVKAAASAFLLLSLHAKAQRFSLDSLGSSNKSNTFDYIIVGGGTAGLAIASRLSEDASTRVAVVEAGIDYQTDPAIAPLVNIPGNDAVGSGNSASDNSKAAIDWGIVTTPQAGANNRTFHFARGKCLGGSSARNFMAYQRGTVGSYDAWANITGDTQWSWDAFRPFLHRSADFTPPNEKLRQTDPPTSYDPAAFDKGAGPLQVSYPNTPSVWGSYVQKGFNELGVKSIPGLNSGSLLGIAYASATIDPHGETRSSSRTSFLAAAESRSNLVVYVNTTALQVVFDNSTTPRTRGVVVLHAGATTGLHATQEVILSAGAFQSPQLLMLSGIGPKSHLQEFGITPLVANENVGQGMEDHILFGPSFQVDPSLNTAARSVEDPAYAAAQLQNYTQNQLGPLTNNGADVLGWERVNASRAAQIGASVLVSRYPADWPHFEFLSSAAFIGNFSNVITQNNFTDGKQVASIIAALVAPQSRGSVRLANADPTALPLVDPAWLTSAVDQAAAVEMFKRTREAFATRAMKPVLIGDEFYPGASVQSDAEILEFARNNLMTVWHPACTCRMAPRDKGGVLDSQLRVYGTKGLRVIDASSFPMLPPGHPQSTVYGLAEKGVDLIKASRTTSGQ